MPEPTITDGLLRYLEIRDQRRADAVTETLTAMTEVERRRVAGREAAVMGYVLGARSVPGGYRAEIPPDRAILESVVAHIVGGDVDDLYPITNRLTRRCATCGKRALDCGHPWPRFDEDE